jgi:hypothetical protein
MSLPIEIAGEDVTLLVDVVSIEVEKATYELDEDGVYETYYRNIRFTLPGRKTLLLKCIGAIEDYIKLPM